MSNTCASEDRRIGLWQADNILDAMTDSNNIHHFQRSPSQLRGYLQYVHHLKKTHGSVLSYVQQHRLEWDTISPSGQPPFSEPSDIKILYNDWPYFVERGIEHLVVWTKFQIDEDEVSGKVTETVNQQIEDFIRRTFCEGPDDRRIDRRDLVWFKNWKSLKSIHSLGKEARYV
jgi:hypothetical protein